MIWSNVCVASMSTWNWWLVPLAELHRVVMLLSSAPAVVVPVAVVDAVAVHPVRTSDASYTLNS